MSEEYDDQPDHPALKNFNRPIAMVKHVVSKALKWAAVGAIVGGVALALVPGVAGGLATALTSIIPPLGAWVGSVGGSAALTSGVVGMTWGVVAGGLMGALGSIATAGDAADDEQERAISNFERGEARAERMQALEQRRKLQAIAMARQEQELGLSPGYTPPGIERGGMGPTVR